MTDTTNAKIKDINVKFVVQNLKKCKEASIQLNNYVADLNAPFFALLTEPYCDKRLFPANLNNKHIIHAKRGMSARAAIYAHSRGFGLAMK